MNLKIKLTSLMARKLPVKSARLAGAPAGRQHHV